MGGRSVPGTNRKTVCATLNLVSKMGDGAAGRRGGRVTGIVGVPNRLALGIARIQDHKEMERDAVDYRASHVTATIECAQVRKQIFGFLLYYKYF